MKAETEPVKVYHYFVSYSYKYSTRLRDREPGFACKEIVVGDPITRIEQIEEIQIELDEGGDRFATILFYQLLRVD